MSFVFSILLKAVKRHLVITSNEMKQRLVEYFLHLASESKIPLLHVITHSATKWYTLRFSIFLKANAIFKFFRYFEEYSLKDDYFFKIERNILNCFEKLKELINEMTCKKKKKEKKVVI